MSEATDGSAINDIEAPARRATDLPPDAPWWARWLDANIKQCWKWASVWWPAVCTVAAETYAQNPQEITGYVQSLVPANWWPHIIAAGFVVSMAARVINFKPKKGST